MLGNKRKYPKYRVSHSGGRGAWCGAPPILRFFSKPPPPIKTKASSMEHSTTPKNEASSEKQSLPIETRNTLP